jgi:hypothetical protein
MAEKKRKEKSLIDKIADSYTSAAKAGYLGTRAEVTAKAGKRRKLGTQQKKKSYSK